MVHTIIISFILVIIFIIQIYIFNNNRKDIKVYKSIFNSDTQYLELRESKNTLEIIENNNSNILFKTILENLNRYLEKNGNKVSDYHLMKDIIERNCETQEEEINTQIPFPLYLGLMGTMLGILIGIGFLVLTGGIDNLLSLNSNVNGGINALLGGISLAMITSISGILLTTIGSYYFKNAKCEVEKNKDIFLSWIQSELLPELATDLSSAMAKMSTNLFRFNKTFANNNKDLQNTLSSINISYKEQAKLLEAIGKLKIDDIASANIMVYEKLQNCTEEIDRLGKYLSNTTRYLEEVRILNEKLGNAEERTQAIERMAEFFEKENGEIDQRKSAIAETVGKIDDKLQKAITDLQNSSESKIQSVREAMVIQNEKIKEVLEEQRMAFKDKMGEMVQSADEHNKKLGLIWEEQRHIFTNKLEETTSLIEELKNLPAVKDSLVQISKQTAEQNNLLRKLYESIDDLSTKRTDDSNNTSNAPKVSYSFKIPKRYEIIGISSIIIIVLYCLLNIVSWFRFIQFIY